MTEDDRGGAGGGPGQAAGRQEGRGARRARGGAGAGGGSRSLCPRSGRLGGWCCASLRRWQVSGLGAPARGRGARARTIGRRRPPAYARQARRGGQLARNSRRRAPRGEGCNRRAPRRRPAGTLPVPRLGPQPRLSLEPCRGFRPQAPWPTPVGRRTDPTSEGPGGVEGGPWRPEG